MLIDVIMPKMGMGMSEGKVIRWHAHDNGTVENGQVILDIETDKATTEITADVDGMLSILVPEGETVPVGTALGTIEPSEGAVVKTQTSEVASISETVCANGVQLNYQKTGNGQPIIFVHGLSSSMELWTRIDQTALNGKTIISYDLRGHGRSEKVSGPHNLEKHMSDLASLMEKLEIEKAQIVGHSLGAMIALELALQHPSKVSSLTLLSTTAAFPQETRNTFFEMAASASFGGMESITDQLIDLSFRPIFHKTESKIVEAIRRSLLSNDAPSIVSAIRMVAKVDLRERLSSVSCPTQILVGSDDILTPLDLAKELVASIKGAQLKELPNCGHAAPVEQPSLVTKAITEFS